MEKHKCKICERWFKSGRALCGHMKSHFTILRITTTKTHLSHQLSEIDTSSNSSSELKILKRKKSSTTEFDEQLETSSVSYETSSEEDHLAMCLMLLSRDKWVTTESKVHECQICSKVFKSGQALGGHKRSHLLITSTAVPVHTSSSAAVDGDVWLIDLNLPAPLVEAEDINQTRMPAVLC